MALTRPTVVIRPWAASGSKRIIPVESQIGITDGAASFADGFPPLTRIPPASGGRGPSGLDMNGILNLLSANIQFINAGGHPRFNADLATEIGGYPVGTVLQDDNGVNAYVNTSAGNTTNFNSSPSSIGVSWMPYAGTEFLNSRPGHTYNTTADWAYLDKKKGLILQWMIATPTAFPGTLVTFPVAFNVACFSSWSSGNATAYSYTNPATTANLRVIGSGGGVTCYAIGV